MAFWSVMLQAWYDIEYLYGRSGRFCTATQSAVGSNQAQAKPKTTDIGCDEKLLLQVVKTAFNQRRKTLHNALKPLGDYNGESVLANELNNLALRSLSALQTKCRK